MLLMIFRYFNILNHISRANSTYFIRLDIKITPTKGNSMNLPPQDSELNALISSKPIIAEFFFLVD